MKRNIFASLIFGIGIGLSCGLLLNDKSILCQQHYSININDSITIDTVNVIEEDGIKWYTLDTIWYTVDTVEYESIDTMVFTYPWGREEIYYFKYKES